MGHAGMRYSLASRELIADSVATMAMAHCFDGLVLVPNCDKIVPGMLMAAARINIPSIVISGGPMLAGRNYEGKPVSLSYTFEAVGARKAKLICLLYTSRLNRGNSRFASPFPAKWHVWSLLNTGIRNGDIFCRCR